MFAKGYHDVAAELYRSTFKMVSDGDRKNVLRDHEFDVLREYLGK